METAIQQRKGVALRSLVGLVLTDHVRDGARQHPAHRRAFASREHPRPPKGLGIEPNRDVPRRGAGLPIRLVLRCLGHRCLHLVYV
jgi:hypothetical protein